jgi:hypothetical protein
MKNKFCWILDSKTYQLTEVQQKTSSYERYMKKKSIQKPNKKSILKDAIEEKK